MRDFLRKIMAVFSDRTDTWGKNSGPQTGAPVVPPAQNNEAGPENPEPEEQSPRDWRERIINNGFAAENYSVGQNSVRVTGFSSGGDIPNSFRQESFTDDGLLTGETETLMTAADGRLIKPRELHGGGRCEACGMLTDKLLFCAVCRMPLCSRCAGIFDGAAVCRKHFVMLSFHRDTWQGNKNE